MAAHARRAADCLLVALLILLTLNPPGAAAIPMSAGLAWLLALVIALPLGPLIALWPGGAAPVTAGLLITAAAQPWALPAAGPVWAACGAVTVGGWWVGRQRFAAVGTATAAAAAWVGDFHLYVGLYPSLHLALAAAATAGTASALHHALPRPLLGGKALHVAGAACLVSTLLPAASSPETRRALRGQSAIGEKLLLLAWSATDLDGDGRSHLLGGGDDDPWSPQAWAPPSTTAPTLPAPALPARPVLVVTADSLRADRVGAYGFTERPTTPHLDGLVTQATLFDRAYAAVPATKPSFQAMLSGGVCGPARAVLPAAAELEPVFTAAGFSVREVRGAEGLDSVATAAQAEADVAALGTEGGITWIHLWDPHAPYPEIAETPWGDDEHARYLAAIARWDRALGILLAQAPPTAAVVVSSDHGEAFGEHGVRYHRTGVYDEQLRVPLVIRPGLDAGPERISTPVGLTDLAPTLRHLRGCPGGATGRSLMTRPVGQRPVRLRTLRLEGAFGPPSAQWGVVHGRWKLVHRLGWNLSELYDLSTDPAESHDLASTRPDIIAAMWAL